MKTLTAIDDFNSALLWNKRNDNHELSESHHIYEHNSANKTLKNADAFGFLKQARNSTYEIIVEEHSFGYS